jgi:hypothetical protein
VAPSLFSLVASPRLTSAVRAAVACWTANDPVSPRCAATSRALAPGFLARYALADSMRSALSSEAGSALATGLASCLLGAGARRAMEAGLASGSCLAGAATAGSGEAGAGSAWSDMSTSATKQLRYVW